MVSLKKIISVILIVVLLITSVSQGLFVFAEDESNYHNVEKFADDLSQMLRENPIENSDDFYMNQMYSSGEAFEDMSVGEFESCRLIVKSKEQIDYQGAIDCVSGYNDLFVLQYDSELSTKLAYDYYLECDSVIYVEPDLIAYAIADDIPGLELPEDGGNYFDEVTDAAINWLSDKIGFNDIKERLAEKIEDDYVLVAVIDSGADLDHDLLKDRLVECDVNLSSSGIRDSAEDDYGHGTHVAGIVVNNTLSNVKIKPYKVLNDIGKGSLVSIAVAVDMAVQSGADVINLSLAADGENKTLTDAIDNAVKNDVNVVVAAGNSSYDLDNRKVTPACIESAITVSATDQNDKLAYFSNYDGPIDIAAPGVNIESSYLDNKYTSLNGTSMAAPQVSAGLALLQTISLDEPASECERLIKDYAIKKHEKEGENHYGAGVLYLKYLLDGKPTTTSPVFSVDGGAFYETFDLEITCPDDNAEIYYLVYKSGIENSNLSDSLKYTKPIEISIDCKVSAIAYADGKYPSDIVTVEFDRVTDNEDDLYDINSDGYITAYFGSQENVIVPDIVESKRVKGIDASAFEDNDYIQNVVLPDSCVEIKKSAFRNCSSLISVFGQGVKSVGSYAFAESPVETVNLRNLNIIGSYAFFECKNLSSITLERATEIGSFAFKETLSLGNIVCNNVTEMGMAVFEKSGIASFNADNLTTLGNNCFLDCINLASASIERLDILSFGAFNNCVSLKNIHMPSLTKIGQNALSNTAIESFEGLNVTTIGSYAFADNPYLEIAHFPIATSIGVYVFSNCTALKIIGLLSLEELNLYTFDNCSNLLNLYLPKATSVAKSAFKNSSIELLRFEMIETIKDLPSTLKALILPGTTKSIKATTPDTDFTVYGFEDSFAEQYANDVGKTFKPVPAIYHETSKKVSVDEHYIFTYAIGFNTKYQWYRNDVVSNEGGTPIEGAIRFYYEPSPYDECAAYYCVITSEDESHYSTVTTDAIPNAPEYRSADYTEYNRLIEEINSLDRKMYDEQHLKELDELLETNISGLKYSEQDKVDSFVFELKMMLELVKTTFIFGDINCDHNVSAIDVRFVLKYVAGVEEFDDSQLQAADMNKDGEITAVDARLIAQKAVGL